MQTMDALYAKSLRFRRLHSRCGAIARLQAMQNLEILAQYPDRLDHSSFLKAAVHLCQKLNHADVCQSEPIPFVSVAAYLLVA